MEEKLKEKIVETCRVLYQKGLITAIGGNVSARAPGKQEFWITPSKLCKPELTPSDLVKLDLQGNLREGRLEPSTEKFLHAGIYSVRTDVNAVVHAHNPFTVSLVSAGFPLELLTPEASTVLRDPKILPFLPPGSKELVEAVKEVATETNVIILKRHGVIGMGVDLFEARVVVELVEELSKMLMLMHFLRGLSQRTKRWSDRRRKL